MGDKAEEQVVKIEQGKEELKVTVADYMRNIVARQMPLYYDRIDFHKLDEFKCPIHQDKGKSMKYDRDTDQFECIECGVRGGVVELHKAFMKKFTGAEPSDNDSIEFLKGEM